MPELSGYDGAGGGGTFVVKSSSNYADSDVLVVAGGGGGGITGNSTNVTSAHASAGTTGGTSQTGLLEVLMDKGAPAGSSSKSCSGQGAGYLSDGGVTSCGDH